MNLVRKSLFRRLIVKILIFGLALAGVGVFFLIFPEKSLSPFLLFALLFAFVIGFLLFYYFDVVRPLHYLVSEVQNLLAGKPYKKVFTERIDEVGVLAYFFNQVTKSLGQVSFNLKDRERMVSELNVAADLQRDILPLTSPHIDGLKVVAKNRPASELGGDSFNVFSSNGKSYIYIGDVTGHGVSAALVMSMVHSFVSVFAGIHNSAYEILIKVNTYIKKYVRRTMFMTMVMLSWDSKNQKMSYVGAGHEHIIVYRGFSGQCDVILSGGVALGMVPDNSNLIEEKEIKFEEGDFIILYTDGITEARNEMDELYGLDRLTAAIKEYGGEYSSDGLNYHIAKDVSAFMGGHKQDDDMTLIVVARSASDEQDTSTASTSWD